jgi:predicted TIM-barrel fold metal-dependent hydrolase
MQRIALEEHFWTPTLRDMRRGHDVPYGAEWRRRLDDLGELRIQSMDETCIDIQVISLQEPGTQNLVGDEAVRLAQDANDILHRAIQKYPHRFAGFAALPTGEPNAAVRELERCIGQLGFKGTMISGLTCGHFLDEERFWPILEASEALEAPISLHPATPHPDVIDPYYARFLDAGKTDSRTNMLARGAHGFTSETQLSAVRLVLSEVLERFPRLQIIVGHLGEGLPFIMQRVNDFIRGATAGAQGNAFRMKDRTFSDTLRRNFYFTTSGKFSHTALQCTIEEIGVERVMFAMDYPFSSNGGPSFVDSAPLSDEDKSMIFEQNARRLLGIAPALGRAEDAAKRGDRPP